MKCVNIFFLILNCQFEFNIPMKINRRITAVSIGTIDTTIAYRYFPYVFANQRPKSQSEAKELIKPKSLVLTKECLIYLINIFA